LAVSPPSVSVVGLGRIGAPLAACLAASGLEVVGVDVDARKVAAVNRGDPPVREPGLGELMSGARGSLRATGDVSEAVLSAAATFVTVPTPAEPDGSLSLRHVRSACAAIGAALRAKPGFHVVAVTSTVMPGVTAGPLTDAIAVASGKRAGAGFGVCYVPEFVALGTAIRDFLSPDVVVIGESEPEAGDLLEMLFRQVCENEPPVVRISPVAAELAKLALNAFLATKVTFANVLAQVCEGLPDADVDAVTSLLGTDRRIGGAYLTGAMGFGGPCLPRDTTALAALAREVGADPALADAVLAINAAHLDRLVGLVLAALPPGGSVGVCGLAFKPGSDALEDAPGAILALRLADMGIPVVGFDPMLTEGAPPPLDDAIELTPSLERCVAAVDVVVLATPDQRFAALDAALLERGDRRRTVIDCWRIAERAALGAADYLAPGRVAGKAPRDCAGAAMST
jgi:UDPglucose 6-dehydrogenase